jgi:HK97 family phage portal protein
MGLLARAISERKADPLALWAEMMNYGRTSKAGPTITLENAFKVAAYFACLRVISQGVAQVPFKLFQETEEDGLSAIKPARDHRLYDVVTAKPNDWQSSYEFREQLAIHSEVGDAYVWKNRTLSGIAELILLDPARMCVEQPDEYTAPTYKYTGKDGRQVIFPADQIWHIRGPSWNGFAGVQMLSIARDALGLSIALDDSVAGLHAKGVRTSGVYTVEGNLSPAQHQQLETWLKKQAAEPGAPLILDRGAKWLQTVMTSVDAQHKEMRDQQLMEVCRFMGVQPMMIGFTDKTSTYASAEQFAIQHVVHCLGPRYARIEQSADINLLTKQERNKGYYFKFNANGLMRGAAKDRAEYYAKALGSGGSQGWMSADEVRTLEELNPRGGDADKIPLPSSQKPPNPDPNPA